MSNKTSSSRPYLPYGADVTRNKFWKAFVAEQEPVLRQLYQSYFPPHVQAKTSLQDWILFAFDQTSTHGLQGYRNQLL